MRRAADAAHAKNGRQDMLKTIDVEDRLRATLEEFVADWGVDAEIGRDTRLVEDLEFDSIDVIQLIVAIETAFGQRNMGFQQLLMQDGRYVDDLSVGQIADFIEGRIAAG